MDENKKLSGAPILTLQDQLNASAMKTCIEKIQQNPSLIIEHDIETGCPYLITKEEKQQKENLFNEFRPKLNSEIGMVTIIGTGSGESKDFDFKTIFTEKKS